MKDQSAATNGMLKVAMLTTQYLKLAEEMALFIPTAITLGEELYLHQNLKDESLAGLQAIDAMFTTIERILSFIAHACGLDIEQSGMRQRILVLIAQVQDEITRRLGGS